jgi:hypothetical protein
MTVVGDPTTRNDFAAAPETFPFHAECTSHVRATAELVFAHLDDHARLAAHMNVRSWRMGWSRMNLHVDDREGRAIGSRMRMDGRVLGMRLSLEEVVTEHIPPTRKVWMTVGTPRLLVIGSYQMGFVIVPEAMGANRAGADEVTLTVFIHYALPDRGLDRLLGLIFGHRYARWCTERMVTDARAAFVATAAGGKRSPSR